MNRDLIRNFLEKLSVVFLWCFQCVYSPVFNHPSKYGASGDHFTPYIYIMRNILMHRECRERFTRHQLQRKPRVIDPGMHHGTCISHVPWCMTVGITNPRWRGKRSRHSRGMHNSQFYVSAKRPIVDPYPSVSFHWHCDNPGTASNASEAYLLTVTHLSGGWSYGSTTIRSALFNIDRFLVITRHNTTQHNTSRVYDS